MCVYAFIMYKPMIFTLHKHEVMINELSSPLINDFFSVPEAATVRYAQVLPFINSSGIYARQLPVFDGLKGICH